VGARVRRSGTDVAGPTTSEVTGHAKSDLVRDLHAPTRVGVNRQAPAAEGASQTAAQAVALVVRGQLQLAFGDQPKPEVGKR
jgi:hypothetical protein